VEVLFPFAEYWWFYAGFLVLVLAMLAVDLGIFHRDAHVVSFRESLTWSVVWVSIALVFNYGFYRYAAAQFGAEEGQRLGLEFLTGYIVEKSLAVDNIFVFVLVFAYFGVPPQYQHRVLFYGIIGALIFRALFIALGSVLMQYALVVALFGVFLLLTGVKMLFAPDQKVDPERNPVIRLFKRLLPVTPEFHGQKFLVRLDGRWHATPLWWRWCSWR
jgi:tellurite resistance protein TerC